MVYFEERQRAPAFVIWLVLAAVAGSGFAALHFDDSGADQQGMVAMFAATAGVTLIMFRTMVMNTIVDGDGVHIRTLYFLSRRIRFDEIVTAEAVTYRPLRDYGGWGFRISGKGSAYNMRGDRGVQLALTDNRRILIGSQEPEALAAAIHAGRAMRR